MRKKTPHLFTRHVIQSVTLPVLFAVLFTVAACTTAPPPPPPVQESSTSSFKAGVPGGALVKTVDISARVTAIDHANRRVMLLGPNGEKKTVTVGPEAVNFDQVRVGDLVNVRATEELVVGLVPERAAVPEGKAVQSLGYIDTEAVDPMPDGAAGIVALAAEGAQPGGLVAGTIRTTATVVAIDHAMRTATLKFKDGSTKTFPVRADIDLSRHQVGERVFFQLTEMIAISVEKQ
jgi:hypothetical protein